MENVGAAYAAAGKTERWNEIMRTVVAKGSKGIDLAKELKKDGWQSVYWNPDAKNPDDGNPEHSFSAVQVGRGKGYYGVDIDAQVLNYRPTAGKNTRQDMSGIEKLREVPFFFGMAKGGMHTFVGRKGEVNEFHWSEMPTPPEPSSRRRSRSSAGTRASSWCRRAPGRRTDGSPQRSPSTQSGSACGAARASSARLSASSRSSNAFVSSAGTRAGPCTRPQKKVRQPSGRSSYTVQRFPDASRNGHAPSGLGGGRGRRSRARRSTSTAHSVGHSQGGRFVTASWQHSALPGHEYGAQARLPSRSTCRVSASARRLALASKAAGSSASSGTVRPTGGTTTP